MDDTAVKVDKIDAFLFKIIKHIPYYLMSLLFAVILPIGSLVLLISALSKHSRNWGYSQHQHLFIDIERYLHLQTVSYMYYPFVIPYSWYIFPPLLLLIYSFKIKKTYQSKPFKSLVKILLIIFLSHTLYFFPALVTLSTD